MKKFAEMLIHGLAYHKQGRFAEAEAVYNSLLKLEPESPRLYYLLGTLNYQLKNFEKALFYLKKNLISEPNNHNAHNLFGNIYQDLNNFEEAIKSYKYSIALNPGDPFPLNNLGTVYRLQSRFEEALDCYEKALALNPVYTQALNNKANILTEFKRYSDAVELYEQVVKLDPNYLEAYINLGICFQKLGEFTKSLELFENGLKINPDNSVLKWFFHLSLPVIYKDENELLFYRNRFENGLETLIKSTTVSEAPNTELLGGVISTTNFYLQYQGLDDTCIQRKYGDFVHKIVSNFYKEIPIKVTDSAALENRKIRVGFISAFIKNHTVGKYLLGWLENKEKNFEILCYYTDSWEDELTKKIKKVSDHFISLHGNIDEARKQILASRPDVLIYTDIGMSPKITALAAMRLAGIQCVTWGHPATSGLPSIDYFLSSELMEPENGQEHYTEKLICLPNISLCYAPPEIPNILKRRGDFGLREDDFIFCSPQSLYKYLPKYDYIFSAIAGKITNSCFVFLSHQSSFITKIFKERLRETFLKSKLDFDKFVYFLPPLNFQDFLNLLIKSDVMLDSLGWSGGNTTLEGIACNLPVITMPGKFMRGRHTYGILKRMELNEAIAETEEAYIDLAVRLYSDKNLYKKLKEKISVKKLQLFNDKQSVKGLYEFLGSLFV